MCQRSSWITLCIGERYGSITDNDVSDEDDTMACYGQSRGSGSEVQVGMDRRALMATWSERVSASEAFLPRAIPSIRPKLYERT